MSDSSTPNSIPPVLPPEVIEADEAFEEIEEVALEDLLLDDESEQQAAADGERFGPYQLTRALGKGGMAEVFLARRAEASPPEGHPDVMALKRILPHHAEDQNFVRMLRDEAQIASAIDHPHVARVYDQGEADGLHFIAMEYIDGVDLSDVLRTLRDRGKAMSLPSALYVARCIADGLHAAHIQEDASGEPLHIIHRDVSPHNILVGWNGAVKLTDFGVAKASHNQASTRSGVIKGKLQYMSPEQALAKPVDPRSDVFSLGLTLYKMLTGRLPFRGQNEFQVYEQILRKQAAPPSKIVPGIPPRVDAIVMRALRKDPAGRFQSAREFSKLLVVALKELSPQFGPRDLARFLAREAPPKGLVAASPDGDDDLDFSGEVSSAASLPSGHFDPQIDRLTHLSNGTGSLDLAAKGSHPFPQPESKPRRKGLVWFGIAAALIAGAVLAFVFSGPGGGEGNHVVKTAPPEAPLLAAGGPKDQQDKPLPSTEVVVPVADSPDAEMVAETSPDAGAVEPPQPDPEVLATSTPDAGTATAKSEVVKKGVATTSVKRPQRRRKRRVKSPEAPVAGKPGFLNVSTLPWSWVSVDGKNLNKNTPLIRHPLPPGKHRIRLKTADGRTEMRTVTIKAGQVSTLRHSF
ncbi:MAG: protein kinase domain-containing protein [Bradymonadia bacterium]